MLRDGAVAEQGSHDELLKIDGGVYRNLWEAQLAADVKKEDPTQVQQETTDTTTA